MRDWRNKIILSGNKERSETFIGPAQSQMEILKSEMSLRGLAQGARQLWLHDDVFIKCTACFDQLICTIWTPPLTAEEPTELSLETSYLLVVTGDQTRKIVLSNVVGALEVGENVECGDDGYGTITSIAGSTIYGSFVHCYDGILTGLSSLATGTIDSCVRRHFSDLYDQQELLDNQISDPDDLFNIFSALDNNIASDISCGNTDITIRNEWTKVYDEFTLGVFSYVDRGGSGLEVWGAVASISGEPITWSTGTWYGPFVREVRRNLSEITLGQGINTHIGFDVWKYGDDFYCGLIGDMEQTLHIFKLNQATSSLEETTSFLSTVKFDVFYDELNPTWYEKYTRLLGYGYSNGNHVLYWGQIGRDDPRYIKETIVFSDGFGSSTTEEFSNPDDKSTSPVDLIEAIWNPVKRELYVAYDSAGGESDIAVVEVELEDVGGYYYVYHTSGVRRATAFIGDPEMGSQTFWWFTGPVPYESISDCPLSLTWDGIDYTFAGVCYNRSTSFPTTYFYGTIYQVIRSTVDNKDYHGRLLIDSANYPKGDTVLYQKVNMESHVQSWTGTPCCSGGTPLSATSTYGSECRPYNVKRYAFKKWIWSKDGHAYEILEDNMTQEEAVPGIITCVWEDDWKSVTSGGTALLKAASTWPYDTGWTSILLSGNDQNDISWAGSVIYKDLVGTEGYFLIDNNGNHYSIGQYDRVFFTIHIEEEVING